MLSAAPADLRTNDRENRCHVVVPFHPIGSISSLSEPSASWWGRRLEVCVRPGSPPPPLLFDPRPPVSRAHEGMPRRPPCLHKGNGSRGPRQLPGPGGCHRELCSRDPFALPKFSDVATITRDTQLDLLHYVIETQRLVNAQPAAAAKHAIGVVLDRVQTVTNADGAAVRDSRRQRPGAPSGQRIESRAGGLSLRSARQPLRPLPTCRDAAARRTPRRIPGWTPRSAGGRGSAQ